MRLIVSIFMAAIALSVLSCNASSPANSNHNSASKSAPVLNSSPSSDVKEERPLTASERDSEISIAMETQLYRNGLSDVRVTSFGGQVILCGYVDDELQKEKAEEIAKTTPDVVKVSNYITVGKRPPVNANKPGGPRQHPCDF